MAEAELPLDIGKLIPALAGSVSKFKYDEEERTLVFRLEEAYVRVQPEKVVLSGVRDREHAEELMARVNRMVSELATDSDEKQEGAC